MSTSVTFSNLAGLLEKYPARDGASNLMPLLQEVQESYGYLPEEALEGIGRHLGVSLSHIYGVVTFYTQFSLVPRGKHIIKLCMGTACHIAGGFNVRREIESYLGIKDNQTTPDLSFTLEVVRCLGTCFLAPVMMIDDRYFGKLTPQKIRKILKSYQG